MHLLRSACSDHAVALPLLQLQSLLALVVVVVVAAAPLACVLRLLSHCFHQSCMTIMMMMAVRMAVTVMTGIMLMIMRQRRIPMVILAMLAPAVAFCCTAS